jgi:hypothetical protein
VALDGAVITCDVEGRVIRNAPGGRHEVERICPLSNNQVSYSILESGAGVLAGVLAPFDGLRAAGKEATAASEEPRDARGGAD